MGPGVRRIMRMAEMQARNDLLDHIEKILLCPLADFSRRHRGSGVRDEERAQSFPDVGLRSGVPGGR